MIIRWLYRKLRARRTARVAGRTAGEPTPRRAGADHGGLPALVQVAAHEFRYDLRAFLRNRQSRFFTLALPVLLTPVGAIALAANLNLVQWDALYRLVDLWPALLILIGAELVLRTALPQRMAAAAGMLLVVLAAAGAVIYVAAAPAIPLSGYVLDSTAPGAGLTQASLDMGFGGAEVNIHGSSLEGALFKSHIQYSGQKPDVSLDTSTGTVTVQDNERGFGFLFGPHGKRTIDLTLSDGVPWAISISGGASHATLALSSVKVSSLDVSGGANNITITLGRPNGKVAVGISGGASSMTIHRPAGVAAGITASGGANSVRLDDKHLAGFGDSSAQTSGFDAASDRYEISVSGGASNVNVVSP